MRNAYNTRTGDELLSPMSVYLNKSDREYINEYAKRVGRKYSFVVREIIKAWVEYDKSINEVNSDDTKTTQHSS